jgi:hypothetical protein
LYSDRRAPPWRPLGIAPKVRAKAEGVNKVLGGRSWAVRVGEVEGAGHILEADEVVVHVQWCEGYCVRALICCPLGGRLDNVENQ